MRGEPMTAASVNVDRTKILVRDIKKGFAKDGGRLDVVAVEVGAAAVLRRLGLVRLAARLEPQLLAIDRLHVPSAAAGPLLLDAQRERFEQLQTETVTELLSRLPVPVAEHAVRESRHRAAVARNNKSRRRRRRYPRATR